MQLQNQSLEAIIRDFRGGRDREGNSHLLFIRFHSRVCRYFQGKGISVEDSEDLAQDVFCQIFKGLDDVRDEKCFINWLFTISRNVFNNEIERRHSKKRAVAVAAKNGEHEEPDTIESPNPASNQLKRLLDKEKVSALLVELQKLPDQARRCVYMRFLHERSDEEIATLLGISARTVRVHVHRARKSLSEALTPVFGDLQI